MWRFWTRTDTKLESARSSQKAPQGLGKALRSKSPPWLLAQYPVRGVSWSRCEFKLNLLVSPPLASLHTHLQNGEENPFPVS